MDTKIAAEPDSGSGSSSSFRDSFQEQVRDTGKPYDMIAMQRHTGSRSAPRVNNSTRSGGDLGGKRP